MGVFCVMYKPFLKFLFWVGLFGFIMSCLCVTIGVNTEIMEVIHSCDTIDIIHFGVSSLLSVILILSLFSLVVWMFCDYTFKTDQKKTIILNKDNVTHGIFKSTK